MLYFFFCYIKKCKYKYKPYEKKNNLRGHWKNEQFRRICQHVCTHFFSLNAPKGHKAYNNGNKYTNNNNMLYIHMYMCNIIFMSNELWKECTWPLNWHGECQRTAVRMSACVRACVLVFLYCAGYVGVCHTMGGVWKKGFSL